MALSVFPWWGETRSITPTTHMSHGGAKSTRLHNANLLGFTIGGGESKWIHGPCLLGAAIVVKDQNDYIPPIREGSVSRGP